MKVDGSYMTRSSARNISLSHGTLDMEKISSQERRLDGIARVEILQRLNQKMMTNGKRERGQQKKCTSERKGRKAKKRLVKGRTARRSRKRNKSGSPNCKQDWRAFCDGERR